MSTAADRLPAWWPRRRWPEDFTPYVHPPPSVPAEPMFDTELCRGAKVIYKLAAAHGWEPSCRRAVGMRYSTVARGRYEITTHAIRCAARVSGSDVRVAAVWADRPPPPERVWMRKTPEPLPERKWTFIKAWVREGTRVKPLNHKELKALLSTVDKEENG